MDSASGKAGSGGSPGTEGRTPEESVAVLTTTLLPADTNLFGNAFGGHLVALIDKTASITASRHARRNVVTASIDRLDFVAPVRVGDILTVESRLGYVGRTSMEIKVTVTSENRLTGATALACTAFLTFVAMDSDGRPTAVPPLILESDADRETFRRGEERARARRA